MPDPSSFGAGDMRGGSVGAVPLGAPPQPQMPTITGQGNGPVPPTVTVGVVTAKPLHVVMAEERQASEVTQAQPLITGLAGHIQRCYSQAVMAKRQLIEPRMLDSLRARRGVYDPVKIAEIQKVGGSEIFANLTSVKCRAAASWIRDIMLGQDDQRPWTIDPTPVADLPPTLNEQIIQSVTEGITQMLEQGQDPGAGGALKMMIAARQAALAEVQEVAKQMADLMADKMEDQLDEGGFYQAMDAFIDDLTTFPSAILKGPILRRMPYLKWQPDGKGGFAAQPSERICLTWERVNPLKLYPSPQATTVDDGYICELHTLSRADLNTLIGVEGYDAATIRAVLEDYSRGGLRDWTVGLSAQAEAQGQSTVDVLNNADGLIDAVQFWGTVQGQWLIDWGLKPAQVPDPTREYHVEAWLIGNRVIKAVLNYDPLNRKPYYKASYEDVPGAWWGNSVCDLLRDCQQVANACARAIVNNMSIASGPQVSINVSRLAAGEQITKIHPWKIWQTRDDEYGGNQGSIPPVSFFQPQSNVQELMAVFNQFSQLADEYSGIPRYLSGGSSGGAGRTASGLSMLVNNAGKSIKAVISAIDGGVMRPMLERLYTHNMQYADDPALKGDVNIVAKGAEGLLAKEAVQQRRNEFLAATANPIDMQIVGVMGRAAILREIAKDLGMDVNDVVPTVQALTAKLAAEQAAQSGGPPGAPPGQKALPPPAKPGGEQIADSQGTPTTDNFSPTPLAPANAA